MGTQFDLLSVPQKKLAQEMIDVLVPVVTSARETGMSFLDTSRTLIAVALKFRNPLFMKSHIIKHKQSQK